MPLGLFLALAGRLVAPAFRGRNAQIGNRPPMLRPPDFRILAEISDQNHLVYASRHRRSPSSKITGLARRSSQRLELRSRYGTLRIGTLGTTLNRPYTLADPANWRSLGYPHIAFPKEMFQFCSLGAAHGAVETVSRCSRGSMRVLITQKSSIE